LLECSSITGRLSIDHRPGLPQCVDALGLDLGRLATGKLFLQAVASDTAPLGGLKSPTMALMSGFVLGSILALTSSPPSAKLSFRRPQSPLGSEAVMAIPAIVTLSRRTFHSSGVKFDLSVMIDTPLN